MAGAPIGNKNATKNRQWHQALDKVLAKEGGSKSEKYFKLQEIAEKLVEKAKEGALQAIKEIGDRMDGRPHATIEATVDSTVSIIEVKKDFSA